MKVTVRAEALITDVAGLLWDNKMTINLRTHSLFPGVQWFVPIYVDMSSGSVQRAQERFEGEIKRSISLLHTHVGFHDTLQWLRKLKADIEEIVRIENLKNSFVEQKNVEKFEALRSRVMVAALRANLENSPVFAKIARTDSEKALLEAETAIALEETRDRVIVKAYELGLERTGLFPKILKATTVLELECFEKAIHTLHIKESVAKSKREEQRELLRNRVMAKAIRAELEHADIFTKIINTTDESELRSAERWIDTKCVTNPDRVTNLGELSLV